MEWIGLYTDYATYKLGLSPKRAQWMHDWVLGLAMTGVTTARNFEHGLGRLVFASLALTWERPFLGPLYNWSAAVRNKPGSLRIPAMLRTILKCLAKRFATGGDLQSPPPLEKSLKNDLVFTRMPRTQNPAHGLGVSNKAQMGKL